MSDTLLVTEIDYSCKQDKASSDFLTIMTFGHSLTNIFGFKRRSWYILIRHSIMLKINIVCDLSNIACDLSSWN